MIIREGGREVARPVNNKIVGTPQDNESTIQFLGKDNILVFERGVKLDHCNLRFCGDGAVMYLSSAKRHPYKLKVDAWRETACYIGPDNYWNGAFSLIISERCQFIMGGGGVVSFGIWCRTADPHLIYDQETDERLNPSRSVLIGDHVWLGQSALILKGTTIGSGSVLAAGAVAAGKTIPSGCVAAGNPCRVRKENIYFSGESVHNYTQAQTEASQTGTNRAEAVFSPDGYTIDPEELGRLFAEAKTARKRLRVITKYLAKNRHHNRFAR